MRADPDFTAYVDARWTPVVRMLVLLGLSVQRAEETAVAAFARMLPDWRRLTREGDLDVELARLVLGCWMRERSDEPAPRPAVLVPTASALTPELEDQLALLEELMGGLARLDEPTRVTVGAPPPRRARPRQLAETLGEPPAELEQSLAAARSALGLGPLDRVCRSASAAIAVSPTSVSRVVARADATRRRQWLVTAAALLVLVAVVGGAFALTLTRSARDPGAVVHHPRREPRQPGLVGRRCAAPRPRHGAGSGRAATDRGRAPDPLRHGCGSRRRRQRGRDPHPPGHHGPGDATGRNRHQPRPGRVGRARWRPGGA